MIETENKLKEKTLQDLNKLISDYLNYEKSFLPIDLAHLAENCIKLINNAKKISKANLLIVIFKIGLNPLLLSICFFKANGIAAPMLNKKNGNTKSTHVIPGSVGIN
jgi:hypothetical protein